MVIKDVKRFAETIIPTSYKHNNFSSFVRQLNFCKSPKLSPFIYCCFVGISPRYLTNPF